MTRPRAKTETSRAGQSTQRSWVGRLCWLGAVFCLFSCARPSPAGTQVTPPQPAPLAARPLSSLLPSPGLTWLVQLRPQELAQNQELRRSWERLISTERLQSFSRVSGFEAQWVEETWLAGYSLGAVILFDARRVGRDFEEAFRARSQSLQARPTGHPDLLHWTAIMDGEPRALVHHRGHFVAFVERDISLAKVIVLAAQGKLATIPSALETRFLAPLAGFEPEAPVRAFLHGPFEDATDAVSAHFVSGAAALYPVGPHLTVSFRALGVWPVELETALDVWVSNLLGTAPMRALGLGTPSTVPHPVCQRLEPPESGEVLTESRLTECQFRGVWSSAQVADSVYRVIAAPLSEMLADGPAETQPAP